MHKYSVVVLMLSIVIYSLLSPILSTYRDSYQLLLNTIILHRHMLKSQHKTYLMNMISSPNNKKPLWKYIKAQRQEHTGISIRPSSIMLEILPKCFWEFSLLCLDFFLLCSIMLTVITPVSCAY